MKPTAMIAEYINICLTCLFLDKLVETVAFCDELISGFTLVNRWRKEALIKPGTVLVFAKEAINFSIFSKRTDSTWNTSNLSSKATVSEPSMNKH